MKKQTLQGKPQLDQNLKCTMKVRELESNQNPSNQF